MKYTALIVFFGLLFLAFFSPILLYAQNTSAGTAFSVALNDKNAKDGNIIVSTPKGYGLSSTTYDSNMYGVLTE